MTVKLLIEHHLEFLSLKRGCRGLSGSTLVKCYIVGNHILDGSTKRVEGHFLPFPFFSFYLSTLNIICFFEKNNFFYEVLSV